MEKLTVPEAILQSLESLVKPANSLEVTEDIKCKKLYDFSGRTPESTISAQLGDFVRKGDSRVKRYRGKGGLYYYYLTKYEDQIETRVLTESIEVSSVKSVSQQDKRFIERDLHMLLSTYLNSTGVSSKTIFHEASNGKDPHQVWTHPDMIGVQFNTMKSSATHQLLQCIDSAETFKLSSYELKREINSDNDLKMAYFQAVSNSSWANYGYLVTFQFSSSLTDELKRLNQAFGIGLIELKANPFQSQVIFQPRERPLDFSTIDKLCRMNKSYESFIQKLEGCLNATEKYVNASRKELAEICDKYLLNESEAGEYCRSKGIVDED
jgi:uncharacterized protein